MGLKNVLLLDADDHALNMIVVDDTAVRYVDYDGPFLPGAKFDGEKLVDPNPSVEPDPAPAPVAPSGIEAV